MGLPIADDHHDGPDEFKRITQQADNARKREMSLGNVRNIIAVSSGKGGVGKTFLTANIAYALAERGRSVGILDADVDCPNVPKFLGVSYELYTKEKRFQPVVHRGVKLLSTAFMRSDEAEPILLRGPAKHRVAVDFLTNTDWGVLDYLLVDLPPGTSDVPMSLLEFGGIKGIIYVTSPQKEALIDTRKSVRMGNTFGTHTIGIVENMSGSVFGSDKALAIAEEFGIPYLGSIPLSDRIFAANERSEIAFLDPDLSPVVEPILDAIEGDEKSIL